MAELVLDPNFNNNDYSEEDIDLNNKDMLNYRGYFNENDNNEEEEPKYFEHGAHFPYYFLYQKLEILKQQQEEIEQLKNSNISEKKNMNHKRSRNRNNNVVNNDIEIIDNIVVNEENEIDTATKAKTHVSNLTHTNPHIVAKIKQPKVVNVYTSFASKLKMNKKLTTKKIINKADTSLKPNTTTKTRNKLEKKIKASDSSLKKSRSKSKEMSTSINKINTKAKLLASSIGNILKSYKQKRNFAFSPGLHPQPTKIKPAQNNLDTKNTVHSKSRNPAITMINNLTNTKSVINTERDKNKTFNTNILKNTIKKKNNNGVLKTVAKTKSGNMNNNNNNVINKKFKTYLDIKLNLNDIMKKAKAKKSTSNSTSVKKNNKNGININISINNNKIFYNKIVNVANKDVSKVSVNARANLNKKSSSKKKTLSSNTNNTTNSHTAHNKAKVGKNI